MTQKYDELENTVLVIDCITKSVYLKFDEDPEMLKWQHVIKAETINTSPHLKDQQLSKDQVPVIVEKCVKFIYAHGVYYRFIIYSVKFKNKIRNLYNWYILHFHIMFVDNRMFIRRCL